MFNLNLRIILLMHIPLISCVVVTVLTRPKVWRSYENRGISEATVRMVYKVILAIGMIIACVNGLLIALYWISLDKRDELFFGWTLKDLIPFLVGLIVLSIQIIVTRPNCNWVFNCQNEAEEKKRILLRKIAFVGLFIGLSCMIIATIIGWFEGIE